ncbi:MAG TPA: hypothetical protein VF057_13140, partial [Thermoanaerobaculia bacterium]
DHIGCIPALVENGDIEVEWALVPDPDLGFGRIPGSDFRSPADETETDRRRRVLALALREEDRSDVSDDELREFLDALKDQEEDYRNFIKTLEDKKVHVVRFGTQSTAAIVDRFKSIGLQILGPPRSQLDAAAEFIRNAVDFSERVAGDVLATDASIDLVDAYRAVTNVLDAGKQRPGAAINMTSIVTLFEFEGRKFLCAGDMEFEKPDPPLADIEAGVGKMRKAIRELAPFDFYKLCHHGSWNGFGTNVLSDLGETRYLGICTGEKSPSHPAKKTLDLLRQNEDDLLWARTDRNGKTTFSYGQKVRVTQSRGKLNNSVMNKKDEGGGPGEALAPFVPAPPAAIPAEPPIEVPGQTADIVEITARVPHTKTRVTITIDVEPAGAIDARRSPATPAVASVNVGRKIDDLLFVSSAEGLARNIGPAGRAALDALRARGAKVLDTLPGGLTQSSQAAAAVRQELARSGAKGVVLIGGYDVVPAQRLDCLPPDLRRRMSGSGDPDNFIVWSDDIYGDTDGDGLPEVPVSRIPDGHSPSLIGIALSTPPALNASCGVRNVARPFADRVYAHLPQGRQMMYSAPVIFSDPRYQLDTEHVYLMLHGDYSDGSRFWGEETDGDLEAVNISNIPVSTGAVVFTGCCWGALTVDKPAGRLVPGQSLGSKTPDGSIALAFLARGARAFVGCTGAHYSPLDEPYEYFGGPMHAAFWKEVLGGTPPAQALFNAKKAYVQQMPHGQTSFAGRAIEFKILRQFTCLGLGW